MGCFLGCFGDAKDRNNKKQGNRRRASPKGRKRNQVENGRQQSTLVDQSILEAPPTNLVSELQNEPKEEEKLSPSPKKRVTFNSNIVTHDHVSVFDGTDSLPECDISRQRENDKDLKASNPGSEDGNSVTSSVGSYPSNHRYHNAVDTDNEAEEYGDSEDVDELDDFEDEEGFSDYAEDDVDSVMNCQDVWSESIVISSAESRVENHSANSIDEEVGSHLLETRQSSDETEAFGPKTNARDRRDYVNSVLNPVENITQWKAIKSKGSSCLLNPQKENLASYSEETCKNMSLGVRTRSDELKKSNQEMAVDASLSNWLVSPEITLSKSNFPSRHESVTSGNSISKGSHSVRSFEDRPILGALTVEELKQISVSSSPKKTSPIRNPDEMPIIGSVGTYWNHSGLTKNSGSISSYKGIPNTTSKYREDKIVHWQSTPFETRLERALNQGSTGA
ncbi:hypothetical protein F511_02004 [Dorcoceras hygrometricum]|uniref:Uncharacterized protein n=1 Tax=Dorcoceras hygrometricum TaxID=472368 RepID=A0A2Z7A2F6_9LAMI|nr:hypothetical protein F511_02004 [Dorcoceras hygrometricum]